MAPPGLTVAAMLGLALPGLRAGGRSRREISSNAVALATHQIALRAAKRPPRGFRRDGSNKLEIGLQ
jgi:hypothetical protein